MKITIATITNRQIQPQTLESLLKLVAYTKDIELNINAVPLSELPQFVDENTSIVILGPQIRFSAKEVEKTLEGKIPYMVIETRDYGMMRGDLVLEQAIKKIESFHA